MPQENRPYSGLVTDLHLPLSKHEASVESDRCYFCFDAPCVTACPTGIDIPLFIRQIGVGNPAGSAKTIFDENILGGMCARVCPTETLCEQACVRQAAENKPVKIGALQRYATDHLQSGSDHPYQREPSTGKKIAVVGAGPAGLACAHRLAMHGHAVTVLDANEKPGGLNEYGIAAYKTIDNFAQREVEFILSVGGIELQQGVRLGRDIALDDLGKNYDAVFLGVGLGDVNNAAIEGDSLTGVSDAVQFIAGLRQADSYDDISAGRRVVVIGGGMTAIDAAVQSKLLGAEEVTLVYRRGVEHMNASTYEQNLAKTTGVSIKCSLQPLRIIDDGTGGVGSVEFEYNSDATGKPDRTGEKILIEADTVYKAIGQSMQTGLFGSASLVMENNRIKVNSDRQTSISNIFAGGDCISGGEDLTVAAVQDGKLAAEAIHRQLSTNAAKRA